MATRPSCRLRFVFAHPRCLTHFAAMSDQQEVSNVLSRSSTSTRWPVLMFACVAMLGSYYCYDIPGALKDQMQAELGLDDFHQNMLYSVYSFPNMLLPLFGGFFVDKFGTNITLFVFCSLITAGQVLFAFGVSIKSYTVMVMGRILFGLGGESQGVAQTTLVALWFGEKELALALGINLSISRLGSVWNDNMSPYLFHAWGLSGAVWFGCFVCAASLLSTIALIVIDRRFNAQLELNGQVTKVETDAPAKLSDIKNLSTMYWLVTLSCLVVYSSVLPFNGVASSILQQRFGKDLNTADAMLGIPFIMSAVGSPFLGGVVDRFGYRAVLLFLSSIVLAGAHALLGFTMITPVVGLVMIGMGYCVYAAAIWPSVKYVVEENMLGTAYGLITAVQNAGLAGVPLLAGYIKDQTQNWTWVELYFMSFASLGALVAIFLNIVDGQTGSRLNKSYYVPSEPVESAASDPSAPLLQSVVSSA